MDAVISLLQAAALAVIGFFISLGSLFTPTLTATNPPVATTTAATFPAATSAPIKPEAPEKSTGGGVPASAPVDAGTKDLSPGPPAQPIFNTEALNTLARASLVNILCTTKGGGSFNPISGSGVIIDSRGIILTNAHVGQYFLLRDYPFAGNVDCVIRIGSPAQSRYRANLLYLPPLWVEANAQKITQNEPTGTGEHDYAFLLITGATNPASPLPSSFPALPMDAAEPDEGQQVLVAAYPAGFLGGVTIATSLYPTSAVATVGKLYTFADKMNVDLFSTGGTVVSQTGSSGGAVVNADGKLQGLIATKVPGDTTSERDLRALTMGHIDRSLASEGEGGITALLLHDAAAFAAAFNANVAPGEIQALENVLTPH